MTNTHWKKPRKIREKSLMSKNLFKMSNCVFQEDQKYMSLVDLHVCEKRLKIYYIYIGLDTFLFDKYEYMPIYLHS